MKYNTDPCCRFSRYITLVTPETKYVMTSKKTNGVYYPKNIFFYFENKITDTEAQQWVSAECSRHLWSDECCFGIIRLHIDSKVALWVANIHVWWCCKNDVHPYIHIIIGVVLMDRRMCRWQWIRWRCLHALLSRWSSSSPTKWSAARLRKRRNLLPEVFKGAA